MNTIKTWYRNSRPEALPQSILPVVLAICLATGSDNFSLWLGLLALIGVAFAHLSLNMFDDYFDYTKKKTDYREELVHEGMRARIGKCNYLSSGQNTTKQLLIACFVFGAIAIVCGSVILYFRGITIFYIALATAFLGIFYSAPPLRLSYHGLGELLIGLIFGPLNMMGTYYATGGQLDSAIIFISIPVGLLVMNIVYTHSILDFIPDKKVGKRTLAVLLNNTTAMLVVLFLINFIPYIIITYGVIMQYLSVYYLFLFLTLPIAVSLCYLVVEFIKDPQRKFTPRPWYGPMPNWNGICEMGIDWFMIRWLTARNLISFFCLIIIVVSLVSYFVT